MKRIPGDLLFIRYNPSNELGLIKKNVGKDGFFVWYHRGQTAARTNIKDITILMTPDEVLNQTFTNEDQKATLIHRFLFIRENLPYNIDDPLLSNNITPEKQKEFIEKYAEYTENGYTWAGMMILEPADIEELRQCSDDEDIHLGFFKLYDDGTEGMAESLDDLLQFYENEGMIGKEII